MLKVVETRKGERRALDYTHFVVESKEGTYLEEDAVSMNELKNLTHTHM